MFQREKISRVMWSESQKLQNAVLRVHHSHQIVKQSGTASLGAITLKVKGECFHQIHSGDSNTEK